MSKGALKSNRRFSRRKGRVISERYAALVVMQGLRWRRRRPLEAASRALDLEIFLASAKLSEGDD